MHRLRGVPARVPIEGAVVVDAEHPETHERLVAKVKHNRLKQAFLDWDAARGVPSP